MALFKTAEAKAPVDVHKMSKAQYTWREMKKHKAGYFLLAPFYILFTIFIILPVLLSLFFSFTIFNMLEPPEWVFMDNYVRLFLADDIFLLAVKNTLIFAGITGPVSYLMSLLFAWFINELSPKVRSLVTLIFYAPSISGNVYIIWTILFSGDQYGLVNGFLIDIGLINSPIQFFTNTSYIMPLVIVVALWTSLGTSFLSLIAGFQVVDRTLYEAAAIDGIKNRWQELWSVTLPTMRPQMMFAAVMSITGAFGFGAIITALVGFPSPEYSAHTIMHHLQDYGNTRFEMGYASAIATLLFLMQIGANAAIRKLLSKVGK